VRLCFQRCVTCYFLIIRIFVYNIAIRHSFFFVCFFIIDKLWRESIILLLLFRSVCADSRRVTSSFVCMFHQCNEGKGKLVQVHALKACSGSRGVAPLILNIGTRWNCVVSVTPRPLHAKGKAPVQLNKKLGGPQGRSVRFGEEKSLFVLPGFEPLFFQAVGYSLC
jgi:hypothetical protein